jgi:hypothetical protein
MESIRVPAGVQAYFGAPAKPMQQELVGAIAELLNSNPEIREAHLPQCYVPATMQQPAQVLVVVLSAEANIECALKSLQDGIGRITLPSGQLDIWPLHQNSNMLPAIRKARCSLKSVANAEAEIHSQPKKWWKIW